MSRRLIIPSHYRHLHSHCTLSTHFLNCGTEPALVVELVAGSMWWLRTGGEDSVEQVLE